MGATGRGEYEYNAALAAEVAGNLVRLGIVVVPSAEPGVEVKLVDRAARTDTASLFISVHHDSIQQAWIDGGYADHYRGYAVFASRRNPHWAKSVRCAESVAEAMQSGGEAPSRYHAEPIKGENRPFVNERLGVHHFDELVVLRTARSPAILIEAGVIVNSAEADRLRRPATITRLGRSIAEGVARCLR